MSVQSTARYAGPFAGNGVTTVFAFAFKVFATTDVVVLQTVIATGAVSNPINGADYTVALNADQTANPGGTITFAVAPPATVSFYTTSSIPKAQSSSFPNPGPWNPTTAESAWDKSMTLIQELDQAALKFAPGDVASTHVLPSPKARSGSLLGFDAAGALATFVVQIGTSIANLAASTGAALVGFIQAGVGAVARPIQAELRESIKVTQYGAVGDGAANDAAAIQAALNMGGDIYFPKPSASYFLGTTALTIGSNTRLLFAKGAKFTANTAVQANLPQAFLQISAGATDVEIDGAFLDYGASPYSSYVVANLGAFIWVKNGAQRIKIRRCRTMWPMHAVFSGLTDAALADLTIVDNDFTSTDCDIILQGANTTGANISGNRFPIARPAGFFSPGNVCISSGLNYGLAAPPFTQSNYNNDFSSDITIANNISFQPAFRPYRLQNIDGLALTGNVITAVLGNSRSFGGASCDDLFTLDFVRNFTVTGNKTRNGGQNGIDILSCQHGTIAGNTILGTNTGAIHATFSEAYLASATSPKLNLLTDRTLLANRDIVVDGNTLNGSSAVLNIENAQGIQWTANKLSFNKVATGRATGEPVLISINDADPYFTESVNCWMTGIRMGGNTYDQGTTKSVTVVAATDIFTSATNHEFTTGDRIEFYVSGTAVTWGVNDFPAGATYYTEYYAIVLSPTTFKIATTYTNAQAGTAVDITNAGLGTAGTVLLVGLARGFTSVSIASTRTDPNLDWKLDENIPVTLPAQLFSTLASLAPGNSHLMNWKFELIEDPQIDYGSGNTKLHQGKYIPVHNRKYSDGVNTYGIEVTVAVQATYVVAKGARIAQVAGATDGQIRASLW